MTPPKPARKRSRSLWTAGVGLAALVLTSACGFTPLYDDDFVGGSGDFAAIEVAPIPERLGQLVRARLTERFSASADPRYELMIDLTTESFQFGFRGDDPNTGAVGDAATTQEQVTLTATFSLMDKEAQEAVYKDEIALRSSFDLVLSDFAIVATREDTQRRLALEAVERIERSLALYFREQRQNTDE